MSNAVKMLSDLVEYCLNPFPWYLAPMGYVREVRQTKRSGLKAKGAWDTHLMRTANAIEESAALCPRKKRAVVVGAGNLLDVPIDALLDMFDEVVLLDIFHARATRRLELLTDKITLIDADVTGIAREVYNAARRRDLQTLPFSKPPKLEFGQVDLIISVNLLSQLSVIPISFLQGHCPGIANETVSIFSRNLIEAHLAWLDRSAAQVCLITDVERVEAFSDGSVVRKTIVEGVKLPEPDQIWDWHIAPKGRVYHDRDVNHKVEAFLDFRPTATA